MLLKNQIIDKGSINISQFPNVFDTFFVDIGLAVNDIFCFSRALGSILGILMCIFGIIAMVGGKSLGVKSGGKFLAFGVILLVICGVDYGLIYFKIF